MKAWYEDSIGFRLARAARAHRTVLAAAMREIGIHPGQEALLQALASKNGRTMGALADMIGVRPPTMTKMVTRLAAEGLVTRSGDEGDGRRARVHLTEEGAARVRELKKRWKQIEKRLQAAMSSKDIKKASALLEAMTAALGPAPEVDAEPGA